MHARFICAPHKGAVTTRMRPGWRRRNTKNMAAVDLTTHAAELNAACAGVRDGTEINW